MYRNNNNNYIYSNIELAQILSEGKISNNYFRYKLLSKMFTLSLKLRSFLKKVFIKNIKVNPFMYFEE